MFGISVAVLGPCGGCESRKYPVKTPEISGDAKTVTFAAADAGKLPQNVRAEQTGKGVGGDWKVLADDSAPSQTGFVLAQTAEARQSLFNLCVFGRQRYRDLKLRIALKAVRGSVDQGGGLLWRYVDANNYYVCLYNPLEKNLRVYRVIAGKTTQLASAGVKLPAGEWHILTVVVKGDLIVASIRGIVGDDGGQIDVRDGTLAHAGQIGLWTKADALTHFDKLSVTGSPE